MKAVNLKIKLAIIVLFGVCFQYTVKSQETLYPFGIKGKYGYINKSGKVVVQPTFDFADKFYEGLAVVKMGGKRGFIDASEK